MQKVKVDIDSMNYHHFYDIQFAFDNDSIQPLDNRVETTIKAEVTTKMETITKAKMTTRWKQQLVETTTRWKQQRRKQQSRRK